ncbi:MAG: hypothetical protein ACI4F6_09175 [Acutalibacteraceae bacterium]
MSKERHKNKKYSAELKFKAVQDYLSEKVSYEILKEKYKLRSSTQLKNWVLCYNGHKELTERSSAKGEIYMTNGKNHTGRAR